LIFSSSKAFFLASEIGKSHKGEDLANKEGEEARQPFPVSDILVQWPLCVTKHCYATTCHHGETICWSTIFEIYFFKFMKDFTFENLTFTDLPFGTAIWIA
jgi:hypothetical protein